MSRQQQYYLPLNKILIAWLSLFIISCSASKMSNKLPAFDKEGHRGSRGLMPENTIPAMIKAIDLGVNTLEMDICFTKDKEALVSHDPFFNHDITTKPDGSFLKEKEEKQYNIYTMNYAEVKRYDVGLKPHPLFPEQQKIAVYKPRLSDLIDSVEKYIAEKKLKSVNYNIETKTTPATDNIFHPGPAAFVDMLMQVINAKGIQNRVIIQSFDIRTLIYLHEKYPSVKTSLLSEADNKSSFRKQLKDLGFTPTIYSPEMSLVSDALIKDCHGKKIKVIPWTVNDKNEIARLKALGVDGIITDFPNLFND